MWERIFHVSWLVPSNNNNFDSSGKLQKNNFKRWSSWKKKNPITVSLLQPAFTAISTRELYHRRRVRQRQRCKLRIWLVATTATNIPQICILDNEIQYFCTNCTCIFHLLTFWRRSRFFYDVKWPVLQLCGRREHMMTNVQFCLIIYVPRAGSNLIPG